MAQMKLLLGIVSIIVLINLATAADHAVELPNSISEKLFEFNTSPAYSPTPLVPVGRRGPRARSSSTPIVRGGAISLSAAIGIGILLMF
jgi:hypothetical protein